MIHPEYRIFPERPENAEIGRNGGFSHRQVWPAMLRRRRPAARHSLPASCHRRTGLETIYPRAMRDNIRYHMLY